ncbi:MAG TPA: hypothetical protein VGT02_06085 [Methylomirabilota bacterium]|jgi:hypothetical protein|nr:hypothetical protein [Methylomirabilota bacterium]
MRLPLRSFLAAVLVLGACSAAQAQVPKTADIAACNQEAQEAVSKGPSSRDASPNTKDQSRAATARRGDAPAASPSLADPQLEGMDTEGAKDPVYQAVYRTCMRKGGF